MESMDYWRLCDELNIVQAALLTVDADPSNHQTNVEDWEPKDRPIGYDAAKTAISNALMREKIEGSFVPEYHDISSGEASAKQFNLSNAPDDPTEVLVDVINGSSLKPTTDFIITGNVFDCSGLGVDGVLEAGDCIRLVYFTP